MQPHTCPLTERAGWSTYSPMHSGTLTRSPPETPNRSPTHLVEDGAVPLAYPGPFRLPGCRHLHHGFDVDSRELPALDDPHPDLEAKVGRKRWAEIRPDGGTALSPWS